MTIETFAIALAIGRIILGFAAIFMPGMSSSLLGFPEEHDTPTTRVFGRLFGVRDIGLGALVFAALYAGLPGGDAWLRFAFLFNAAHDLGDALCIAVPLVRRQGIDRAAGLSLAFALGGGSLWVLAWFIAG